MGRQLPPGLLPDRDHKAVAGTSTAALMARGLN